jgi:hypothetical protein
MACLGERCRRQFPKGAAVIASEVPRISRPNGQCRSPRPLRRAPAASAAAQHDLLLDHPGARKPQSHRVLASLNIRSRRSTSTNCQPPSPAAQKQISAIEIKKKLSQAWQSFCTLIDLTRRLWGNMGIQRDSSLKSILREFPTLARTPGDPNKNYRHDRKADVQKWCESDTARRRMAQMESMIAGLERMVKTLKTEIEAEQVRSGVNDPAQFNYPTIATALIRRRDNAMRTIDMLRRELTELDRVAKQTGEFIIA